MSVTPETRFLVHWSLPPAGESPERPATAPAPSWPLVVSLATTNRVAPLLYHHLNSRADAPTVPSEVAAALRRAWLRNLERLGRMVREGAGVLEALRGAGVPALVLRGPGLGTVAYGDPALRPFTDLDLLVPRQDLAAAQACLTRAGYATAAHTFEARYFQTYHLHLPFKGGAQGTTLELHWALDHRYVPFCIPYDDIIQRARTVEVEGCGMPVAAPEDDLLCNIVHAAKHAYYLPFVWNHPELAERIIRAGDLLLLCDIAAELRRASPAYDPTRLAELARDWGIEREMRAVLSATARLFGTPPTEIVRNHFGAPRVGRLERFAHWCLTGRQRTGQSRGRFERLNARALFRPIRVLDLLRYAFPERHFLQRHYRARGPVALTFWRVAHPCVAATELLRHAWAWWRARRHLSKPD